MRKTTPLLGTIAATTIALAAAGPAAADDAMGWSEVTDTGWEAFESYLVAEPPKAFALAPDGSIGWREEATMDAAKQGALAHCTEFASTGCQIVSTNQTIVYYRQDDGTVLAVDLAEHGQEQFREAVQTFLAAGGTRALATAPDGAWGFYANEDLPLATVEQEALARCAESGTGCAVMVSIPDQDG